MSCAIFFNQLAWTSIIFVIISLTEIEDHSTGMGVTILEWRKFLARLGSSSSRAQY